MNAHTEYVVMVAETSGGHFTRYFVPTTIGGGYVFRLTEHTQRFSTFDEAQHAVELWKGAGSVWRKFTVCTEAEAEALVALYALAEVE